MRSFSPLLTGFSADATLRPIRQCQPVFNDLDGSPNPWNDRVSSSTTDAAATAATINIPRVVPVTDTPVTVPDVTGGDDDGGNNGGEDAYYLSEITLIWTATFAVPHVQPKPVHGIAILKTVDELENT
ncbi:hypothetical protein QBC36DRAFT_305481 [Triangularia setosa]|uniref:Uncharacterized protein n=1 Tax=Triangularia setosa TaxID=2587417 RepID=A0AAN7A2V6_9PEZI|nr:hypothetical protein QBC36DRAFT_305481 [Podospora setosa]